MTAERSLLDRYRQVPRFDESAEQPDVVYVHDGDADGLVCALIANHVWPNCEIVPLSYGQLDRIDSTPCVVMDLNLPMDHPIIGLTIPEDGGIHRDDSIGEVLVIDHHRSDWYPKGAPPEGDAVHFSVGQLELLWHPQRCAASIAAEALLARKFGGEPLEYQGFVLDGWSVYAQISDYMDESHHAFPMARALTSLVRMVGVIEAMALFISDDGVPYTGSEEPQRLLHAVREIKRSQDERAYQIAEKTLMMLNEHCYFGLLVGGSISDVADKLIRTHNLGKPVMLCMLDTLADETCSFGLRGEGSLEIAKSLGGGGHPSAAGFGLPSDSVTSALQQGFYMRGLAALLEDGRAEAEAKARDQAKAAESAEVQRDEPEGGDTPA